MSTHINRKSRRKVFVDEVAIVEWN